MTQQPARICILGGGFGGLTRHSLAAALGKVGTTEIILVEQSDRFLFSPLLYELLTGELQTWLPRLLKKFYITLVCDSVKASLLD